MRFLDKMDLLEFFQKWYLQRWLVRSDLTGMRHSVEVRVPFLDLELVDMMNNLSRNYKTKYGAKWILKKHLGNILPPSFVNRRKRGFDFPLNNWMGINHIDFLKANIDLYDCDEKGLMKLHNSNNYRDKRLIFSLCSFALWMGH